MKFDIKRGGLVCDTCKGQTTSMLSLSRSTIKQLLWIESGSLDKAIKIRFDKNAAKEGLDFLEIFVPYHLGKSPRSLAFLNKMRSEIIKP